MFHGWHPPTSDGRLWPQFRGQPVGINGHPDPPHLYEGRPVMSRLTQECANCGQSVKPWSRSCPRCGRPLAVREQGSRWPLWILAVVTLIPFGITPFIIDALVYRYQPGYSTLYFRWLGAITLAYVVLGTLGGLFVEWKVGRRYGISIGVAVGIGILLTFTSCGIACGFPFCFDAPFDRR